MCRLQLDSAGVWFCEGLASNVTECRHGAPIVLPALAVQQSITQHKMDPQQQHQTPALGGLWSGSRVGGRRWQQSGQYASDTKATPPPGWQPVLRGCLKPCTPHTTTPLLVSHSLPRPLLFLFPTLLQLSTPAAQPDTHHSRRRQQDSTGFNHMTCNSSQETHSVECHCRFVTAVTLVTVALLAAVRRCRVVQEVHTTQAPQALAAVAAALLACALLATSYIQRCTEAPGLPCGRQQEQQQPLVMVLAMLIGGREDRSKQ